MSTHTQTTERGIDRRSRGFAMIFPRRIRSIVMTLLAAALFVGTPLAHGATIYAANNGVDATLCGFSVIGGVSCGAETSPCRSIQCAIAYADPGDVVIVGPGRYGDHNRDGDFTDHGDESGSSGCGCMLSVNKAVTLVSSHGAAATVIDATNFTGFQNVHIAGGAEFGRPGKGFTVTTTGTTTGGNGIVVVSSDVKVRGNQVVARFPNTVSAVTLGIDIRDGAGNVRVEGNQVLGAWGAGIEIDEGSSGTVRKNHISGSLFIGVRMLGEQAIIVGNSVTNAGDGILLGDGAATVTGNAAHGNNNGIVVGHGSGFDVDRLKIHGNNLFGNDCGIHVSYVSGLDATKNYWGASTGPGAEPADGLCGFGGSSTTTAPFATKPFGVDPPLRP